MEAANAICQGKLADAVQQLQQSACRVQAAYSAPMLPVTGNTMPVM
jgi:hypothetical protein